MDLVTHTMLGIGRILNPRQHERTHHATSGASLCASVAVLEADTSGQSCHESSPTMEESVAGRPERPKRMSGGRSPLSDHVSPVDDECEECDGKREVERKRDGALVECAFCRPAPRFHTTDERDAYEAGVPSRGEI